MEKNPLANAGDIRDAGSIPRLGRSPGERTGYQTSVFLGFPGVQLVKTPPARQETWD